MLSQAPLREYDKINFSCCGLNIPLIFTKLIRNDQKNLPGNRSKISEYTLNSLDLKS